MLCFHKQLSLLFLLYLFVCFGTKHPISSWVKVNCTASHLNKLYHCRLAYTIEVIQSFSCLRAYLFPCWPANCSICKGLYFVFFHFISGNISMRHNLELFSKRPNWRIDQLFQITAHCNLKKKTRRKLFKKLNY